MSAQGREVAGAVKMPVLAAKQDPPWRKVTVGPKRLDLDKRSAEPQLVPASRWRPG